MRWSKAFDYLIFHMTTIWCCYGVRDCYEPVKIFDQLLIFNELQEILCF